MGAELLLFLVLMMGVGLGSAAAAWALRPTQEERTALLWYRDWSTPQAKAMLAPEPESADPHTA
jgi:hypothetical protein